MNGYSHANPMGAEAFDHRDDRESSGRGIRHYPIKDRQ
jgi:hypothetical protein